MAVYPMSASPYRSQRSTRKVQATNARGRTWCKNAEVKLPASTFKFVQVFLQKPGRFVERLVVDVSCAGESDSGTGSSLILINRQAQTDRGWNCAASSSAFSLDLRDYGPIVAS